MDNYRGIVEDCRYIVEDMNVVFNEISNDIKYIISDLKRVSDLDEIKNIIERLEDLQHDLS